jgi:hypothetical protein
MTRPNTPLLLKLVTELHKECLELIACDAKSPTGQGHLCLNHNVFAKKAAKALGISKPRPTKVSNKLTFLLVKKEAEKRGLVIQHVNQRMDGETYRYEVFAKQQKGVDDGIVTNCKDLDEAWSEIYHWNPKG